MEAEVCKFAPDSWEVLSVADVCRRVTSGGTPSRKRPEFYQDGVWPWVKTQELLDGWIDKTEEQITEDAVAESSAKVLPAETILMAMYGATVGQLGILRRPMTCNQACCAVIVDPEKADFRYLYYQLLNSRAQIRGLATGAAQQNLSGVVIKSLRFPFPPLPEQKAIARILGTLDDKIELNRRMNATLEAMARALFQSWFVDFDPVRRKSENRKVRSEKIESHDLSNFSLSTSHFDHLFPDSFQPSELGEIPKGWSVKTISDVCTVVTRGVTPKYQEGSGRFIINQRVNRGSDLDWSSLKELAHDLEVPSDRFATTWDVLVNCLGEGTLGRVHLYKGQSMLYAVDQHMSICRPKTPAGGAYLYQTLASPFGQAKIESLKTGSTGMTMFNISKLRGYDLIWPTDQVLTAYFDITGDLWRRIAANDEQSRTLATLRDTLLPKLLSGEVM